MKMQRGKQIKLIISLISVGIFVYSYFIVYEKYTSKTTEAYNEIKIVQQKIREREEMLIQEEEIQSSLEEINRKKHEIIDNYPVHIAKEDNFIFVEKLQNNVKINIMSLDVSDNTDFYTTILPLVEVDITENQEEEVRSDNKRDSDAETTTMTGLVNTISMSFLTSYEGLKDLSEYIRKYPEPTVIDRVSISYDSSTGALAGNLTLKRFALTGTGKEYKGTHIDGIDIGTDNIFGTDGIQIQNNEQSEQEGN